MASRQCEPVGAVWVWTTRRTPCRIRHKREHAVHACADACAWRRCLWTVWSSRRADRWPNGRPHHRCTMSAGRRTTVATRASPQSCLWIARRVWCPMWRVCCHWPPIRPHCTSDCWTVRRRSHRSHQKTEIFYQTKKSFFFYNNKI